MSSSTPQFGLYLQSNGKLLLLDPGEHLIGRSSQCDICLDGPGISRKHARLHVSRDGIEITDLDSKNGTFVNDEALSHTTRLNARDALRIGRHELMPVAVSRVRALPTVLPAVPRLSRNAETTATDVTATAARVLDLVEILAEDLLSRFAEPNTIATIATAIDDLLDGAGIAYPRLNHGETTRLEHLVHVVVARTDDPDVKRWGIGVVHRLGTHEAEYVAC